VRLSLRHVTFRVACEFVRDHHRHHKPPVGHIISVGAFSNAELVGVAMLGRPLARMADDGSTWELLRLCVLPERKNAASWLLSRARRVCDAVGVRMLTYTLPEEGGASLRAAGMLFDGESGGGSWSRDGRERTDERNTGRKHRWVSRRSEP